MGGDNRSANTALMGVLGRLQKPGSRQKQSDENQTGGWAEAETRREWGWVGK